VNHQAWWWAGLVLLAASTVAAAAGDEILGTWITDGGASKVDITRGDSGYSGKIIWLREPTRDGKPVLDAKNTNPALRSRPILGLEILSGFTHAADGTWKGGTAYSPRRSRSYPAEIALTADNRLDLKVKDGILSKHTFWTR
jgi:uncharacterized protein (DUF2147 family)